ncbi:hypothetical protein BDV27DRAFT_125929 [Aspergillus caelatus]|uniref:Uncharacterized protein n=1 Tax=Aspergillus caelatus TaxID=61420 RepID=A0A5N7A8A7_9EURO|nr:uncharacterized protein BDV27DRAFT_125929 [Aspergillus caelatus]KAE8366052.1 hypothetical protein BDV27DRAFT_125929 [Aspergillus caelatus]
MQPATERPFKASRFAYRTNTDGLTASNPGAKAGVEDAKESYKCALKMFESADKEAREEYQNNKEAGLTIDTFGTWVMQNDPVWVAQRAEAEARGAALTSAAMFAFGQDYMQKIQQGQSEMAQEAYRAGFTPEVF